MTISPFFKCFPAVSEALRSGVRSGVLNLSIGVGTVIMKILHPEISFSMEEKLKYFEFRKLSLSTSLVLS